MSPGGGIGGGPPAQRVGRPTAAPRGGLPPPHPARFRCGLILMAASFALYPVSAVILALPVSNATQAELAVAAWAASWGAFALGSALAGAEGVERLRRLTRRRR